MPTPFGLQQSKSPKSPNKKRPASARTNAATLGAQLPNTPPSPPQPPGAPKIGWRVRLVGAGWEEAARGPVWLAVVRRGVDGVPCAARVTPSLALAGVWPTQEDARADADALLLLPVLHGASAVLVEPGGVEPEGVKHGGAEPNGQSSCPCERYPFGLVVRAKAAYPAPKTACEPVGASACATPLPPMVG